MLVVVPTTMFPLPPRADPSLGAQGVLQGLTQATQRQEFGPVVGPQFLAESLTKFDGSVAAAGKVIAFPPTLQVCVLPHASLCCASCCVWSVRRLCR